MEFLQKLKAHGIDPGGELTEGKLTRATCSCKPTKKGRDGNGWYLYHADEPATLTWGCWNSECLNAAGGTMTAKRETALSPAEQAAIKARIEADRKARELERQQVEQATRTKAARLWKSGHDVSADHDYIKRKGIKPVGIKQVKDMLLIPMTATGTGEPESLQLIFPDSGKKFLTGTGAIPGPLYHVIRGTNTGPLYIVEGYATGLSVYEATGASVVVAFSSGKLPAVAAVMRDRFPDREIIIAGDTGNGSSKATEAALKTGRKVTFPVMPEGATGTDWNDVHAAAGLDEVARQLATAALPVSVEAVSVVEPIQGQGPDAETQPQAEPASTQSEPWPEPIPFGEIQTPEIPCSILPGWLGEYAAAVTENTQTPAGMSAMMALAVVAACCQKRFKVARTPEHVEPLSIWPVTALPPANRKTAVVNAFTGPLTAWEKERGESQKQERSRIAAIREVTESRIKALHVQAAKADDATDRNRLIEEACRLKEQMPDPLNPPRIFTGDVTAERLQALMMEHGERMALLSDEGGIFAVMAGLYTGGKANIDVFLKGHAGSSVRVDRQDRTAHLDEPALTFGLCIQPDIIRRLSETSFRGNGCLARFLFCLPASKIGTRSAYSSPIPESVKAAYHAGIQSLLSIPPVFNEHGKEQARIITLDHSAARTWEAFFDFIEHNMKPGGELEPLQDWAGKLAGAALRIAGLMAIVEQGEAAKQINEQTMTNALNLCELLIPHAQAAFELMAGDDAQQDAKHVFTWILEKGSLTFKQADVYRELRRFNDADRLNKALRVLTTRHIISEPMKSGTGGRPSITFEVNPAVFEIKGGV